MLLTLTDVTEDSLVSVKTQQGNFEFKLAEISYGKWVEKLDGAVEVERIAAARPLTADPKTDDDYPSAAVATDGTAYVAYTNYTPGLDRNERHAAEAVLRAALDLRFISCSAHLNIETMARPSGVPTDLFDGGEVSFPRTPQRSGPARLFAKPGAPIPSSRGAIFK